MIRNASLGLVVLLANIVGYSASLAAQELKSPVDVNPIQLNSKWKGKITQRGSHPDIPTPPAEIKAVLVVTKLTGDSFEAELREKTKDFSVTYLVEGTANPGAKSGTYTVTFETVEIKSVPEYFVPVTKVPFSATIEGGTLKGSWKYPKNDRGITLEGTIDLKLK